MSSIRFDINPLRDLLLESVDFDAIAQALRYVKLFLSATNVRSRTGARSSKTPQVSADVVMASACLPFLYKAVEIDGEHYWDGGYMSAIRRCFRSSMNCESRDVMIVHINPMERDEVPMTAPDILNRINEISFNSSLLDEMRAINFVTRLIEQDWLKDEYKNRLEAISWCIRCAADSRHC
jgi:NTE family protein